MLRLKMDTYRHKIKEAGFALINPFTADPVKALRFAILV